MKEVNFKNRVPLYPGRITLTPVEGETNTYTLERADAPTEPGTPLDKATFNSIIHSRLTGRFYNAKCELAVIGKVAYTGTAISTAENGYVSCYKNTITVDGLPASWTVGQRVTIQLPIYSDCVIQKNTINGIECNTILQSGERYEIVYNGSSFDAKAV